MMPMGKSLQFILLSIIVAVHCDWPNSCNHRREESYTVTSYQQSAYTDRSLYCCFTCVVQCSRYSTKYRQEAVYRIGYRYEYYTAPCYGYCSSYQCRVCASIPYCDNTRCSTSTDQQCYKCEYDRGGEIQAYSLVERNGVLNRACEQRCSWRPDSKFCYPGYCPTTPSSCTCAHGFAGPNCLEITDEPTFEECTATFLAATEGVGCTLDCSGDNFVYCGVNTNSFTVDWAVSYDPSVEDINRPYYVNETGFGIVTAVMRWQLMRDQTEAESGEGICLGEESHILNIPHAQLPRRICRHSIDVSTKFKHNDKVSLTFTARNGGYIKINNYDLLNIVTVDDAQFYGEVGTERTAEVSFDFVPPQHCSVTSSDCRTRILDVGNPYKRHRDVTVTWEPSDWTDVPAGVHHYDCEAFRLSVDTGESLLGIRTTTSHAAALNIDASVSSAELRLPDTGVFAIILSVHDAVGNVARARRFLIFDESSVIQVDENNPIAAPEAHQNSGIVWLNKSKGKITVSWEGHFYNSFYRDGQFLNGIEEGEPSRWLYDEETGQPPLSRSREPIQNDNGVTRYKLGFIESTSGSTDPEDWIDLGQTSHVITISDDDNEFITVWLKAFDVMNNTIEDEATFYIDKTQPTISSMTVVGDPNTRNTTFRRKKMAPSGSGVLVKTHDDDSGILEVKWQIFDKMETTRLYGQGKIEETSPMGNPNKPCTALTCTCLPEINVCFYLDYLIEIDSRDLPDLPTGDTECIVKVTAVNNAMLETTGQVEILLTSTAAPKAQAGASTGSNVGGIAGGSSVVIVIIVVVVVLIVIVVLRRRKRRERSNAASDGPITFSGVAKEQGEENPSFENKTEAAKVTNNYSQQGKILNTAKAASRKADDSALSREEMEFSSTRLVLREKLQPGIHRATATGIGGKPGDAIVAVKAMKDTSNRTQREHLMHELDIMLAIIPHENIIRLLGCITQTGSPKPSIIMEFAPYGNLGVVLKRSTRESQIFVEGGSGNDDGEDIYAYNDAFEIKNPVKSENLMLFAEQIATGMEHLSSLKIIHRKLGARNVMVGDGKICKIASFSLAIRTDRQSVVDKVEGRIPIRWMAPESLTGNEFSFKSDVWTYGIVLWEIVTLGALPYSGMANKEIAEHIKRGQRMEKPTHCTDEIYSLMLRCWTQNPGNRPTFPEILSEIRRITKNEQVVNLDEYDSELYGTVDDF